MIRSGTIRKLFLGGMVLVFANLATPRAMAQATVVVEDTITNENEASCDPVFNTNDPIYSVTAPGHTGGGGQGSYSPDPLACSHSTQDFLLSSSLPGNWVNPHDGEQIFYSRFSNNTSADQSFKQIVEGTATTTYEGAVTLINQVCLKIGKSLTESVKKEFPVVIPKYSTVVVVAYVNMMDRGVEEMRRCVRCQSVLDVYDKIASAGRGVNEYFN